MKYHFSRHAQIRMQERAVSVEEVIDCINSPDIIEQDSHSHVFLAKKLINNTKGLLVAFDKKSYKIISVITVIKTSKILKYFPPCN